MHTEQIYEHLPSLQLPFTNRFLKMSETNSFVYHSDFTFGRYSAIILQLVFINMLIL